MVILTHHVIRGPVPVRPGNPMILQAWGPNLGGVIQSTEDLMSRRRNRFNGVMEVNKDGSNAMKIVQVKRGIFPKKQRFVWLVGWLAVVGWMVGWFVWVGSWIGLGLIWVGLVGLVDWDSDVFFRPRKSKGSFRQMVVQHPLACWVGLEQIKCCIDSLQNVTKS